MNVEMILLVEESIDQECHTLKFIMMLDCILLRLSAPDFYPPCFSMSINCFVITAVQLIKQTFSVIKN